MLSKEKSSTIFWVFGMTRPGIESRSPRTLANTLSTRLVKVKLATTVMVNLKAPFSLANTLMCRALLLFLDCFTLLLIHTLYCWVLSKAASSTIFWIFGTTWPGVLGHWRKLYPLGQCKDFINISLYLPRSKFPFFLYIFVDKIRIKISYKISPSMNS